MINPPHCSAVITQSNSEVGHKSDLLHQTPPWLAMTGSLVSSMKILDCVVTALYFSLSLYSLLLLTTPLTWKISIKLPYGNLNRELILVQVVASCLLNQYRHGSLMSVSLGRSIVNLAHVLESNLGTLVLKPSVALPVFRVLRLHVASVDVALTSLAFNSSDAGEGIFRLWCQYHACWCFGS